MDHVKKLYKRVFHKKDIVPIDSETMDKKLDSFTEKMTLEAVRNNREIAQQCLPLIHSLKVKTAHKALEKLRSNTLESQLLTLSEIDYFLGCSSRFVNQDLAIIEYERAYNERVGSGSPVPPEMRAAMIYSLCAKGDKELAFNHVRGLRSHTSDDIWTVIPELVFADDFDATLARMPVDVRKNPTILYYSLLFKKDPKETFGVNVSTYKVSVPETLTDDNLPEWLFGFSVLISRFLREWDEMLYSNVLKAGPACIELNEYAESFIELLGKTELGLPNPDIKLFSLVTDCIIYDLEQEWLTEMLHIGCTRLMHPFRLQAYATFYERVGFVAQAKQFLAGENIQSNSRLFNYRFYLAFRTSDFQYALDTLKRLIDQKEKMPACYLGFLLIMIGKDPDTFKEYIDDILVVSDIDARAFREICHCFFQETYDSQFLFENVDDISSSLRPFVAIALDKVGHPEQSIDIYDRFARPDEIGLAPTVYFHLLKKNQENIRLDEFLKKRREKGFTDNEDFLLEEHTLASLQNDYERTLAITEALLELSPDNPGYLASYVFSLSRTNHVDRIKEIVPRLKQIRFEEELVRTVFGLLQEVKLYEESIDFLYTQIESYFPSSQVLLLLFQDFGSNSNSKDFVCQSYDTVEEGSYVTYTHNGEERNETIDSGQRTACLIGKSMGETVTQTDKLGREDVYTILAVHNKYKRLLDRINDDIEDNKFDDAFSVSKEDYAKVENFEDNLRHVLGVSEKDEQIREESRERYKAGVLPLGSFINNDQTIASIYERLFSPSFFIYTPPTFINDIRLGDDLTCKAFVLDLPALVLLYEVHLKFGFDYELPFIISRGAISLLESTILEQSSGLCGKIPLDIIRRLHPQEDNLGETWFETRIRGLLAWVNETISIEEVPAMANFNPQLISILSYYNQILTQASILMCEDNRIMVSEEITLLNSQSDDVSIVSANWLLHNYYQDRYPEIAKFLLECGYVGIDLESDYVFEQYEKYANGQPSTYLCCKENFGYQSLPVTAEIQLCKSIYEKETVTDADKLEVKSILTNLLEKDNNPHLRGVLGAACACYPALKKALEDALDISSDNQQDEDSNDD